MEAQAQIVWNFLYIAYRQGLLDGNIRLLGTMLKPEAELEDVISSMEEKLAGADMASINREIYEKWLPLIEGITDEEFLRGLAILIDILKPAIERAVYDADGDLSVVTGKVKIISTLISSLKPLTAMMAPALIDMALAKKPGWKLRLVLRRMKKKIVKMRGRQQQ